MNVNKPANPTSVATNSVNLTATLQSCMLAGRHALRRKLRDVADLQKLKDEKSALKASPYVIRGS